MFNILKLRATCTDCVMFSGQKLFYGKKIYEIVKPVQSILSVKNLKWSSIKFDC